MVRPAVGLVGTSVGTSVGPSVGPSVDTVVADTVVASAVMAGAVMKPLDVTIAVSEETSISVMIGVRTGRFPNLSFFKALLSCAW